MPDVTPNAAIPFAIPADNVADYPTTSEDLANRLDFLLPRFINKTASETVTSSTTLQDDDHLFFSVEANGVYILNSVILWESSATIPSGIKIRWEPPAGSTFDGVTMINDSFFDPTVDVYQITRHIEWTQYLNPTYNAQGIGIGNLQSIVEHYQINVGATAGTVKMQWAQQVANATNTRVKLNSYLMVHRVA